MRLELPGDGWAELRDVDKVPEILRRPVKRKLVEVAPAAASGNLAITPEVWDSYEELQDVTILAMVSAWSLGGVTSDVLLNQPGDVYDVLANAVKDAPMSMFPNMNPEAADDPKAPTEP